MEILLIGLIGSFLYAVRGGNYFGGGRSTLMNRLAYTLPLGYLVYFLTGLTWESGYFTVATFLTIALGHGVFMDMGRWKPSGEREGYIKEHEYPITWIIGPENYRWKFSKRWKHNLIGMSLIGLIRHTPVWSFYGHWDTTYLIIYTLLGLLHGPLYELGHQTGKWFNFLRTTADKFTMYGEHYVGLLMVSGVYYLGTG